MPNTKPPSKFLIGICLLGFVLGLFVELDDGNPANQWSPAECLFWALIGFIFFLFFVSLGTITDSFFRRFKSGAIADKGFRWGFFGHCGWFSLFLGLGMAVSSLWMDFHRVWEGCVNFGAGLGLIVGVLLGSRLAGKSKPLKN